MSFKVYGTVKILFLNTQLPVCDFLYLNTLKLFLHVSTQLSENTYIYRTLSTCRPNQQKADFLSDQRSRAIIHYNYFVSEFTYLNVFFFLVSMYMYSKSLPSLISTFNLSQESSSNMNARNDTRQVASISNNT